VRRSSNEPGNEVCDTVDVDVGRVVTI
jgi:hypothetical protein